MLTPEGLEVFKRLKEIGELMEETSAITNQDTKLDLIALKKEVSV